MTVHNRLPTEAPEAREGVPEKDNAPLGALLDNHLWRSTASTGLGLVGGCLTLALVCAAPARPDRLPVEAAPKLKLNAQAARQPLPAIALKSGTFLPVGWLAPNLAAARKQSRGAGGIHAIAQFDDLPGRAKQAQLSAAGLTLVGALPAQAFFVKVPDHMTAGTFESLGLRWLGAVYPEDKLPPRILASGLGGWALRPGGTADLRVKVYADVPLGEAMEALRGCDAGVLAQCESTREFTVNLAVDRLEQLVRCDCVRWVEEVPPPQTLFNDGCRAMAQADLAQAAPYHLSGAGVALGIWDGGNVATNHADFSGRLVLGETNGVAGDHATHVAGTMAGDGSRSVAAGGTERQWRGVAPGAQIVSYNYDLPIPEHQPALNEHAVVLSQNSWGTLLSPDVGTCDLYGDYSNYAPEYDQIVTGLYGRGINVVFAAGNYRTNSFANTCGVGPYFTVGPPATAKNVLSVGAIQSDTGAMTLFSSWGPVADGRLKPELVAPGAQAGGDAGVTSTRTNNAYGVKQGTSMAAPVVSGAIALLVEDYRAHYHGQNPSPSVTKALLLHTAMDLDDATSWYNPGPDYASGYGLVQIRDAVDQLRAQGFLIGRVGHRETNTFTLPVPEGTASVKLTLVWDDPAALENAAVTLVNDLDLVVLDPQGTRRYPWTLNPADPAAPAIRTAEDHLNVIEQVVADTDVLAGDWLIRVIGHNVPEAAPQKYTLAFTPTTIPVPPILVVDQTEWSDGLPDVANHDGVLDPGETVALTVVLRDTDAPGATNVTGRLTTSTPGVMIVQAESVYPELPPGGLATNLTPFTFKLAKTIPCGTPITLSHITTADGFGFTNSFTSVVGQIVATNWSTNSYESVDVPKPIPDPGSTIATHEIAEVGRILDVEVSVRANHEWFGDLEFLIEHPDGTRVALVYASSNSGTNYGTGTCGVDDVRTVFDDAASGSITNGAPPFAGSFRPVEPLAGLNGKLMTGTWRLHAADRTAQDSGTLLCWGLRISHQQEGYVCTLFNRTPVAFDQQIALIHDIATNLVLGASDPDGDPLIFNLLQAPAHGTLWDFSATAGTVTCVPDAGYLGTDSFTFEVSDGDAVSAPGTVTLDVAAIKVAADVGLHVTASAAEVLLGGELRYGIAVTNAGPGAATGVWLEDVLPTGVGFLTVETSQGIGTNENGVVRVALGDLGVGSNAVVTLAVRAEAVGWVTNRVSVGSAGIDLQPANNEAEAVVEVLPAADVGVAVVASVAEVLLGSQIRYEMAVTNTGPGVATGVRLEDVLPVGLGFVGAWSAQGTATNENGVVRVDLGELGVGSSAGVTLVVRADQLGVATNRVRVRMAETDLNLTNNEVESVVVVVPAADVGLRVTASAAEVLLGGELRYEIVVANGGPSVATGLRLEDVLPVELGFVEVWSTQGTATNENGVVRVDLGELGVGIKVGVMLMVRADQLGVVTNVVSVGAQEGDPVPANNSVVVVTAIRLAADLAVGMTASASPILSGSELRYEMRVTNMGLSLATEVALEDVLPAGVSFLGVETSQGIGSNENGVVQVTLGELGVGSNAVVVLTVRGDQPGVVTNRVRVRMAENDLDLTNNEAEAVVEVLPAADVGVTVVASAAEVLLGGEIRYEMAVTNAGPGVATGVRLEDLLPVELGFVDVFSTQGTGTNENGVVRVELGELRVGSSAGVTLVVRADRSGVVTNVVSVRAEEGDVDLTNNGAEAVVDVVPAADVGLRVTASAAEVLLGGELRYGIAVTNAGPGTATAVWLEDVLPAGVGFLTVKTSQGTGTNENGVVRVELGELGVGSNAVVRLAVRAQAVGWVTNRVSVGSAGIDLEPGDNVGEAVVEVLPAADLGVAVVASAAEVLLNSELRYEIAVTNTGPGVATGVRLEDVLPVELGFVEVLSTQGTATNENGVVRVELGELGVGSNAAVTLVVRADQLGVVTNRVQVRMAETDLNLTNNEVEAVVDVVPAADVGLSVTASAAGVLLGSEIRYEIVVTNAGPSVATGVRLEDVLPVQLDFVEVFSTQGTATNENGVVRVELGELGVRSSARVTLVVRANQLTANADPIGAAGTPFAIGIVPDPQGMADVLSATRYNAVIDFFADRMVSENIQAVVCMGDIVRTNRIEEWTIASNAWERIRGDCLIVLYPGNHDEDNWWTRNYTNYNRAFSWTTNVSEFGGSCRGTNGAESLYFRKTISGIPFLFLALEFAPTTNTVAWASNVVAQFPNDYVIFSTHDYLYSNGARSGTGTPYNAKIYLADGNNGEDLWNNLVNQFPNFVLVASGHHITNCTAFARSANRHGRLVNELFTDYQAKIDLGLIHDYARLLTVDPARNRVGVRTYDVTLGTWLQTPEEQFEFPLLDRAASGELGSQLGVVTNVVSVSAEERDPRLADNSVAVVTAIKLAADVGVGLTAEAGEVWRGGEIRYAIGVTNFGPNSATEVVLEDLLPSGVGFLRVEASQGIGTNENGLVRVKLGDLGVGSSAVVTLAVRAQAVGWVTNRVSLRSAEIDLQPANNEAEAVVEVLPAADVGVSVAASAAEVLLNSEIRYEIAVTNAGPSVATGVRLEDVLPVELGFVEVVSTQGTATNENGVIRVELGELGVGSHAGVTLTVQADQLGVVTNTVNVAADTPDPQPGNNSTSVVTTITLATDVGVGLSAAAAEVLMGGQIRYAIGVTNLGPSAATGVVVEDVLPAGVGFLTVETSQGAGTNENGVVRAALGDLGVGGTALVTLTVRADQLGLMTNRVRVRMVQVDLDLTNNEAEAVVKVLPAVDVGAGVVASAAEVLLGSEIRYEMAVTNAGPGLATGVRLEDVLPVGLGFVGVVSTRGTATNENGVVRVELGELGVRSSARVTLVVRAHQLGVVTNAVSVQAAETDVDLTNNEAQAVVEVVPAADVGLSVAASSAEVILGNEVQYRFQVSNLGPSLATGVLLEDRLAVEFTFVGLETSQGTGTNDNGLVQVELGELGVGSNAVVTLTLRADQLGVVTNTVNVVADAPDPEPGNNSTSVVTTIKLAADVGVTVAASASQVALGHELHYDLLVTNAGPGAATAVLLEDALPGGVEFLALGVSQGTGTNESGVVRVALGQLDAGGFAAVTLWVRARQEGQWTNQFQLARRPLDPNPANDQTTAVTVILPYAALRLAQSAAPAPVLVNDALGYTLVVSNLGPYAVSDATLVDTLPASVDLLSVAGGQGTYSTAGNVVNYVLGDLPVDSGLSLTITVAPRVAGPITNVAVLSSAFTDPADGTLTSRVVTEVLAQPPLGYTLSGTKFTLQWPSFASDYILETTTQLREPAWVEDRNPRVIVDDRITATVKTFGGQAYYRLRKP